MRRRGALTVKQQDAEEELRENKKPLVLGSGLEFGRLDGWDIVLACIMTIHVLMAPYTKVEESFNIQVHLYLLYHGWNLSKYDHFVFPGVVPRTFLGALAASLASLPAVAALRLLRAPKLWSLYAVRLTLGTLVILSFKLLRRQVTGKFGQATGRALAAVTAAQFHLLFYASRPLPNVFALALCHVAFAYWLAGRPYALLRTLVAAMVVFRCDMVILLGCVGLSGLLTREIRFWRAFWCCAGATAVSLAATAGADSLMWRRVVWPEGEVLFFNTALNKSSEWGVSPSYWYFTSALPRALLGALPLAAVGALVEKRVRAYVAPAVAFVALYSALPHKELRFIMPALSLFNLAAATAIARATQERARSARWRLCHLACLSLLGASAAAAAVMSAAAWANYPGGRAITLLHSHTRSPHYLSEAARLRLERGSMWSPQNATCVHTGVLPAMTGVSRFCEAEASWSEYAHVAGYDCLAAVAGFSRLRLKKSSLVPLLHLASPPHILAPPPATVWPYPTLKEMRPQVYIHGSSELLPDESKLWPGCASS
eukprot:jgi/Mesen1/2570/ME000162S01701